MKERRVTIKMKKTASNRLNTGDRILSLGIRRYRGEVAKVIVLAAIWDRLEIFCISAMGDANTGDPDLLCHVYRLLLFHNRVVRKPISGDSSTLLHKTDDAFCGGLCLGDLIQCLFYKFLSIHIHRSFGISFCYRAENIRFAKWKTL